MVKRAIVHYKYIIRIVIEMWFEFVSNENNKKATIKSSIFDFKSEHSFFSNNHKRTNILPPISPDNSYSLLIFWGIPMISTVMQICASFIQKNKPLIINLIYYSTIFLSSVNCSRGVSFFWGLN
ncbi:hypothetical protein CDIK_4018 [Cucumispora dikerogammari]|nr:hypothetical protein CDIK_4018 [Cucumispora dikerogammari]